MKIRILSLLIVVVVVFGALGVAAQDGPTVAVMTPFLAQPGTQLMVEAFESYAVEQGYEVEVIDTAGDVAALVSRMEDVALQGVDAIVIQVDPAQIGPGLQAAADAGIPVFGMDSGSDPLVVANVTSNGYAMAAETASYVVDRLEGQGNVVMFVFDPFPPVQKRGAMADAIFANEPDIEVLDRITPSFDNGPLEGARNAMDAVLAANPEPGSISAVWSAWDDPALGALQAIEAAGRGDEGIVIVGIDGTEQALDAISGGSSFEATVRQDFTQIAQTTVDVMTGYLADGGVPQTVYYAPAALVTAGDLTE
jgi:ribose transport system substrate-binding protein